MKNAPFHRSYQILAKKFLQYLFPSLLTTIALSLNEFVDSMLVANLLGSHAMAVVNLGFPVMLLMATIYTLLGVGGSTLYAVALGERRPERAGKILCLSLLAAGALGCAVMAVGLFCPELVIPILCQDSNLAGDFSVYFHVLALSAPLLSLVLTFVAFLPPSGVPQLATAVNIVANVVNLLMDYIYITCLHMGAEGAAWATLTGYLAGILLIPVILFLKGRADIRYTPASLKDLSLLRECVDTGGAAAMTQFGFAVKFAACNALATLYGGTSGVVAFSFCLQAFSLVSVFYGGIVSAAMPLLAVLHGQRDFSGAQYILKKALRYSVVSVAVFVAWFEIAPEQAAGIYDIVEPEEVALAALGLRIFALCFLFRCLCIVFMYYLQVLGEKRYAMAVSLFDGFAGLVPMAYLLCSFMGLDGLWWAHPLNAVLLLAGILLYNRRLSGERYKGLLLAEREDTALRTWEFTMDGDMTNATRISGQIIAICEASGLEPVKAKTVGLMLEEMAIYNKGHLKIVEDYDVLLHLYDDHMEIDFRSLGDSCNPLQDSELDEECNIAVLRRVSSALDYDYVLGMNSTHIVINLDRKG